jgi:hypothetical protein
VHTKPLALSERPTLYFQSSAKRRPLAVSEITGFGPHGPRLNLCATLVNPCDLLLHVAADFAVPLCAANPTIWGELIELDCRVARG